MNHLRDIGLELRRHAPFTLAGTGIGLVIMAAFIIWQVPNSWSYRLFWFSHPMHVVLSALATTAMYRKHGGKSVWKTLLIGYFGSVGIATVSDSLIPYVGEWFLQMPHREIHLGFVEKWWLVNPLAFLGIAIAWRWPETKLPHAGHVLFSTWASLFHLMMSFAEPPGFYQVILLSMFLFMAVWIPCCTSDIVFPLFFVGARSCCHQSETN